MGLTVGVSNFTKEQLEHLLSVCTVPPAVNQIEVHPYLGQRELIQWCQAQGIRVMGYSPLGSSADRSPPQHGCTLMNHPVVASIAEECGKTPAQVLIRWGLQRTDTRENFITIPKSAQPERVDQNGDVIDWALSETAMSHLDRLDCDYRYFISYLKTPDNDVRWHDGRVEMGTADDFVSGRAGANRDA